MDINSYVDLSWNGGDTLEQTLKFSFKPVGVCAVCGPAFDLFSTWIAITFFQCVEMNPLGNQPILYFPIQFFVSWLLYTGVQTRELGRTHRWIRFYVLLLFLAFPFISFVRNMLVIGGVIFE